MDRNRHSPLRILHIDPEKNWGGGEVQVLGLVSYLARKGHRSVLLADPDGELFKRCGDLNLEYRGLAVRNELDFAAALRLRQLIAREPFDIVHFHTKRAHALAFWAPRGPARPNYVVTRRMDYPLKRNWYTKTLYNDRVDVVIAISRFISGVLTEGGVEPAKIRVIHSGIDVDQFSAALHRRPTGQVPVIGSLAVMEERKGQRCLLEAAHLLKSRGRSFRYVLGGDGSLREELRQQAKACGMEDDVRFPGWITDVPAFLSTIDFFVMPSLFEGLGIAVLEAMAAGRPAIATNVGGLAESVADSDTGFLVPPRNPAALADAIEKLADNPPLARRMGERAAQRARKDFSLDRMAAENESLYYTLLNENARVRSGSGFNSRVSLTE